MGRQGRQRRRRPCGQGRALRHQRAELRALQDLRHQGSEPEHKLGAAAGRRGSGLPEDVSPLKLSWACGSFLQSAEMTMRLAILTFLMAVGALCFARPASADTTFLVKTRTYAVTGTTGSALVEAMDRKGPRQGLMTRAVAQTG